jgi:uncharacterized Zn-binding protein involved in type VI secretion
MNASKTIKTRTLGALFLLGSTLAACGQDRYVSPTGSDGNDGGPGTPWATVAHGVAQMSGGTLWLYPGTHTLADEVIVDKSLVVRSQSDDAQDTIVAGDGTFRCFRLSGAQAALRGLTITNGNALLENGGGVLLSGAQAALHGCTIAGSMAQARRGRVRAGRRDGRAREQLRGAWQPDAERVGGRCLSGRRPARGQSDRSQPGA